MRSYFSDGKASTPCIWVWVWLVASEVYGVGICVSQYVVRVSDTRTGWDIDHPVKWKGLFLPSPKLDDLDIIVCDWGRHMITIRLWDSVSCSSDGAGLYDVALTEKAQD